MTVLGILSVCLERRYVVSPKEGWREPINIYTAVALPPANNKSLVLKKCLEPLVEWEKAQKDSLLSQIRREQADRKTQEKRLEILRGKAAKEEDAGKRRLVEEEVRQLECSLIEPRVLPQLFTNDVTPEALAGLISAQGGRLGIFSDEGGVLETLSGLYTGGSANVDILLKGIDGGHVRVKRQDKTFNLEPYLTIALAVQPAILQNMAQKRAFMGNGMLERFLYLIPKSKLGYRTHETTPLSFQTEQAYHGAVLRLLALGRHGEADVETTPQVLRLSPFALKNWRDFQSRVEVELRPHGKLSGCMGWGGKISGFTLRLAGLLHLAEHSDDSTEISGGTMGNAFALAEMLIEHAVFAFGLMGSDETTHLARHILEWIQAKGLGNFTKSEVTVATKNRASVNAEKRDRAIQELIDRRILSEPERLPTKKPTFMYRVNPRVLKPEKEKEE